MPCPLCPAESAARQWQRPDAFPVAANTAFAIAGSTGGSAGSPSPVGGNSVMRQNSLNRRRLPEPQHRMTVVVALLRSAVLDRDLLRIWLMPSIIEPCTWASAPEGFMIWLPTSPAAQILSTLMRLRVSTVTSATSAK